MEIVFPVCRQVREVPGGPRKCVLGSGVNCQLLSSVEAVLALPEGQQMGSLDVLLSNVGFQYQCPLFYAFKQQVENGVGIDIVALLERQRCLQQK